MLSAAVNCAADGAGAPDAGRPLRRRASVSMLDELVVCVAKKADALLGTPFPGKLRLYQSNARNQKSLSFTKAPPTPNPAIFRQSFGLNGTLVNTPGDVRVAICANGLKAPQSLSRS